MIELWWQRADGESGLLQGTFDSAEAARAAIPDRLNALLNACDTDARREVIAAGSWIVVEKDA